MKVVIQGAWHARGLWLGPCAWLLALAGTLLLPDEAARWWGVALILLGCGVTLVAWRNVPVPSPFDAPSSLERASDRFQLRFRGYAPSLVGFGVSALLSFFASAAFLANPNDTFGLAGWLWVVSIGALLISCLFWPSPVVPDATDIPGRWPAWEKAVFAGLVVLAAILRLWNLNQFPFQIYGDEIETGRFATESYLHQPAGQPGPSIFSLLWPTIDLPGLWFLTVAQSVRIGGFTLWSLRLPAALFGTAIAVPFYGFVRSGWGRGAAIAGTAMFAFSAVAVHYSRVTLNNIVTPFFWTVCFLFLIRGLRSRRPIDWALAGLAGGLSEYGYYGTRLLPFILLIFFAYLLIVHRRVALAYLGHFGLVALGYLVAFGPLAARYVLNPGLYTGRSQGMMIWDHFPTSWADFQNMLDAIWPVLAENLLGVSTHPSQEVIYYAPFLFPAEAALLALGVVLLSCRWKHPASFLALLALVGVFFVGGTLVVYGLPPIFAHWIPALPLFYVATSAPIGAWLTDLASLPSRIAGRVKVAAFAAVGVGLVALGLWNINFYFRDYYADSGIVKQDVYRNAAMLLETRSAQARYQGELGGNYVVRFLGDGIYLQNPDVPYFAQGQDYGSIADPQSQLPMTRIPGKGLAFLLLPGSEQYRDLVRRLYPGGEDGEVRSRTGRHLFYIYVLAP